MSKKQNRKGSVKGKSQTSKNQKSNQNTFMTFGALLALIFVGLVISSQLDNEKKTGTELSNNETNNASIQSSGQDSSNSLAQETISDSADGPVEYSEEMVPDMINEGSKLIKQGKIPEALEILEAAVNFETDWEDAYYYFARALQESGDKNKAVSMYKKAVELWPEYSEALNNLGNLLVNLKRYDEAIPYFQKAIESYPEKYPLGYTNMGKAYALKGEIDKAVAQFTKALQLEPSNYNARINLGTALMQQNRVQEAAAEFQYILKMRPNDPIALDRLSRISQKSLR